MTDFIHPPSVELAGTQIPVHTIYCIGRNYRLHAAELGNEVPEEPVVFLKAASSLRGLAPVPMAFAQEAFHFEAEVVLLIGQRVALGSRPTLAAVSGVGLGLDLTRREKQSALKAQGLPWTVAKSFTGAAVVTPFLAVQSLGNLHQIQFQFSLNGVLKQLGHVADMTFSPEVILRYLASFNELCPGDLVFTGTPEGVGPMRQGDRFQLEFVGQQKCFSGQL